jgi:hypothetical protein
MNDVDNATRCGVKVFSDPSDSETVAVEEPNMSVKLLRRLGRGGSGHGMQKTTVWVKKWVESQQKLFDLLKSQTFCPFQ